MLNKNITLEKLKFKQESNDNISGFFCLNIFSVLFFSDAKKKLKKLTKKSVYDS